MTNSPRFHWTEVSPSWIRDFGGQGYGFCQPQGAPKCICLWQQVHETTGAPSRKRCTSAVSRELGLLCAPIQEKVGQQRKGSYHHCQGPRRGAQALLSILGQWPQRYSKAGLWEPRELLPRPGFHSRVPQVPQHGLTGHWPQPHSPGSAADTQLVPRLSPRPGYPLFCPYKSSFPPSRCAHIQMPTETRQVSNRSDAAWAVGDRGGGGLRRTRKCTLLGAGQQLRGSCWLLPWKTR